MSIWLPRPGSRPILSHPLAKGLVGLWDPRVQGMGGDKLIDLSGHGNDGTFSGAVVWDIRSNGSCLDFSGDAPKVVIPHAADFSGLTQFTLIVQVWRDNTESTMGLFGKGTPWEDNDFVVRLEIGDRAIRLYDQNMKYIQYWLDSGTLVARKWYQIATVFDGSASEKVAFYINGKQPGYDYGDNGVAAALGTGTDSAWIGTIDTDYAFDGRLSKTCFYNRALAPSEIRQLYADPYAIYRRDPIELWGAVLGGGGGVVQVLAGTIAAQSIVFGSMSFAASLAGSTAATTAVSAGLSVNRGISGPIAGISDLTGSVAVVRGVSGTVAAVIALSGGLTPTRTIEGVVTSQSDVSGSLSISKEIQGVITSQSDVSGALSADKKLIGSVTSQSDVSGSLSSLSATGQVELKGSVTSQSDVSGFLSADKKLVGFTSSQSVVAGALSADKKLIGSVTSQSDVSGALSTSKEIQGVITSQSDVSGALSADKKLIGSVTSQSDVSGSLSLLRARFRSVKNWLDQQHPNPL